MSFSIIRPIGCYVYTHCKATTGEVFYVGKGTAERAWDKYGRNEYWQRIVAKHGLIIKIEKQGLSECEAHNLERELIASMRANGVKLANLTDGGEGTLNPSAETREKIGSAHRGKPKSEAHKEKIRLGNIGRKVSEEVKEILRNRIVSESTRLKMKNSGKARKPPSEETLKKLSHASKRHWMKEEYREKVLLAVTGKKRSDEFRKKMSEIALNRPDVSEELRKKAAEIQRQKWKDPAYIEMMKKSHIGKPWSEARRSAYERKKEASAFKKAGL